MRGCVSSFTLMGLTFGVLILAIIVGGSSQSVGAGFIFFLFGCLIVVGAAQQILDRVGRVNMDDWLSATGTTCKYRYAFDGTGIAVDGTSDTIHLAGKFKNKYVQKSYPFASVRQWHSMVNGEESASSGMVQTFGATDFATALQVGAHNIGQSMANVAQDVEAREKNGLYIDVADIDFPQWFVKFRTTKGLALELRKWMEILEQHVNKS
jgi:hypothetical protein